MLCFVVVVVPPNLSLPNLSVFVVVVVVVVMTVVVFFFSSGFDGHVGKRRLDAVCTHYMQRSPPRCLLTNSTLYDVSKPCFRRQAYHRNSISCVHVL